MKLNKTIALLCALAFALSLCACSAKKENTAPEKLPINTENVWENIENHKITSTLKTKIQAPNDHKKLTSVCYDGERYAYLVFESENNTSVICKYDMKSDSQKRVSTALAISGINGICCKKNSIVLLYGDKNVVALDNSSFEKISNYVLFSSSTDIAYSKKHDKFFATLADGSISVLNSELEHIFVISPIDATAKITSITCNSKYIFTLTAVESGSEVIVYDFDGNYVSTASVFDVSNTPVSFYCDNEVFYMAYQGENGALIYRTEITKK